MPEIEYLIASLDLGVNFLFLGSEGIVRLPIPVSGVPGEKLLSFILDKFRVRILCKPSWQIKIIKIICLAAF